MEDPNVAAVKAVLEIHFAVFFTSVLASVRGHTLMLRPSQKILGAADPLRAARVLLITAWDTNRIDHCNCSLLCVFKQQRGTVLYLTVFPTGGQSSSVIVGHVLLGRPGHSVMVLRYGHGLLWETTRKLNSGTSPPGAQTQYTDRTFRKAFKKNFW